MNRTERYKQKTSAYLFDYGGTLDTGGQHWGNVLWQAWQKAGIPVSETLFREAYVYAERAMETRQLISPDDTFRQTLDVKLHLEMEYAGCPDYRQQVLDDVYALTCQHTAHSLNVLKQLAERCPLVLVSNFYGNLHTVLKEFGLDGIFTHVVESAAIGVRKPDVRIFQKAIELLEVQPAQTTMVGDSIGNDIRPAQAAGCRTVWLRGQQWNNAPVDETLPDCIITDIEELLKA